jgi:two-component system, OmpR family, alkaline phosphatase synthesis response regulator PhoP
MPTILVVDDEPRIAQIEKDYLERAGYSVVTAGNGMRALDLARTRHPALVVLDLKLPGVDGLDVARRLRHDSDVPIIMVTARVEESDRLAGLDLGADDYLAKPFSPRELVARVKAVLRRAAARPETNGVIRAADLSLDLTRLTTMRGTTAIDLTPAEFQLLAALARQPGRVLTRARLLDAIGGGGMESFDRAIDTHVKNLRRKLDPDSRGLRYIFTVYGLGYKFRDE